MVLTIVLKIGSYKALGLANTYKLTIAVCPWGLKIERMRTLNLGNAEKYQIFILKIP
jgi:hypothetical protein